MTTIKNAQPARVDLRLTDVTREFDSAVAVSGVTFEAHAGEFVSFLGPSGCGKTTTLSMIAGFLDPSSGSIEIRGRRVDSLPPEERNTGMVFQNYALFPHMSVAENVGFGLRMRHVAKPEIRDRVAHALQMVRMTEFAERRPVQLSGGQQQRVALARALVIRPDILLLDEPFGALDRQLREGMQLELKSLQQSIGITTVFVTHDQEEALSMSDRIVVMNKGLIEQIGTPVQIYEDPDTMFVARFIGKSSIISGVVANDATGIRTPVGDLYVPVCDRVPNGAIVECVVRPENLRLAAADAPARGDQTIRARVTQAAYQGATMELHVVAGELPLVIAARAAAVHASRYAPGDEIEIAWSAKDTLVFHDGKRCR